ncbi:hypothetical protein, partial [Halorhodospira sp. 9622]|uniref:hypothetical protein n=1 Tax=Halorhodospira sp. 9622 TaxID=2899136 RepID=UPI001EE86262
QHWVNRLEQDGDLTQGNLFQTMMDEVLESSGMGLNVNEDVRDHQVLVARTLDEMAHEELDLQAVYDNEVAGEDGFLAQYVDMLQSRELSHYQDELVGNSE